MKSVFRELKEAVLDGMAHSRDKLHQVADNLADHFDNVVRQVRGMDTFEGPDASAVIPVVRPGFNADGSVNPDDFRTPRDGAYYWSGMWPRHGDEIAAAVASGNNATTLEMLCEDRGIELPRWNSEDPAVVEIWTQASEAYAAGASGTVHAVLGDNMRSNAVWWTEFDRIRSNSKVDRIVKIDPDTLAESIYWSR